MLPYQSIDCEDFNASFIGKPRVEEEANNANTVASAAQQVQLWLFANAVASRDAYGHPLHGLVTGLYGSRRLKDDNQDLVRCRADY